MVDDVISRYRNRLSLCYKELAKAKFAISFWSNELRMITEILLKCDQGCFDFFDQCLKDKGDDDEISQEVV